jgi:non-heme chloroperoxidase
MASRQVQLPNGVTLDYVEHGGPSEVSLVLLHGIADSRRLFEPILERLPVVIRAVVPSQRGHGDSSRPDDGYRPEDFAGDLDVFMAALDIESAVVVGASSGGVVARRFAIDHPSRVRGLVLLGSPFRLRNKTTVEEMWKNTFEPMSDPVDEKLVRGFAEATIGDVVPRDLFDTLVAENLKPTALVWKGTMRGLLDDTSDEELGRIAAPTLIAWGDRDEILSLADQEALADGIPGADLIVFEDGGHMFYLEDPKRTAAELISFVERVAP